MNNDKSRNIKSNRKDVAGLVQNVLNNKTDLPELVANLHRSRIRLEKETIRIQSDVLREVLDSNLLLARAVAMMADEIRLLKEKAGLV